MYTCTVTSKISSYICIEYLTTTPLLFLVLLLFLIISHDLGFCSLIISCLCPIFHSYLFLGAQWLEILFYNLPSFLFWMHFFRCLLFTWLSCSLSPTLQTCLSVRSHCYLLCSSCYCLQLNLQKSHTCVLFGRQGKHGKQCRRRVPDSSPNPPACEGVRTLGCTGPWLRVVLEKLLPCNCGACCRQSCCCCFRGSPQARV